jgi:hypothetical protein
LAPAVPEVVVDLAVLVRPEVVADLAVPVRPEVVAGLARLAVPL